MSYQNQFELSKDVKNSKKIILIGPPAAGKTTIKKCFFETANPLSLLNTSLEPTVGFKINLYNILQSEIGVFDLAGQENEKWFGSESSIFSNTDIIILVFDVNYPLNKITVFIDKVIITRMKECKNASIYCLLHKIDSVSKISSYKTSRMISEYMNNKYPKEYHVKIFQTSITRKFFLQTFQKFEKIIRNALNKIIVLIDGNQYQNLSLYMQILIHYSYGIKYSLQDLQHKFKISVFEADKRIRELLYLNLIKLKDDDGDLNKIKFELTERADFIALRINQFQNKINESKNFQQLIIPKKTKVKIDLNRLMHNYENLNENQSSKKDIIPMPSGKPLSSLQFISSIKKKEN